MPTQKQLAVLAALSKTPLQPSHLYPIIWPDGKYVSKDPGSMGGGPSRSEVAVNFFMHRNGMANFAYRETIYDKGRAVAQGHYKIRTGGDAFRPAPLNCSGMSTHRHPPLSGQLSPQ